MKARGPKLYKKQKHSGEISEADFKFMYAKPDGDIGFDPEHNRKIIEESIKKNKANEKRLKKEYLNKFEETADASAYFLKKLASGSFTGVDSHTAALRYFGKRELARLRGEEIKARLMAQMGPMNSIIKN